MIMTELVTIDQTIPDALATVIDAMDNVEIDLGKSEHVSRFNYAEVVQMTLASLVADIEQRQMDSLGRLLATHGITMSEAVAEMFTARMTLCHTDAKSQVAVTHFPSPCR